MNQKLILVFILTVISLLFVTASRNDKPLSVKQILSYPVTIRNAGANKLSIKVRWYGFGLKENEKVEARLRCFSSAVTVTNAPQPHVFGDRNATFEVIVNKKNVLVDCRTGAVDGEQEWFL
ncbi:2343_t:CDS:2 [Acaulospora morrowiae]|uniref:2343_t:CDS:1 n=1 Tax=Acaulospora morrowiae TaxID=94023 RepID=A0A9N9FCY8_9GLOM|nr:2343_t:CDS:2 [Acaulospora morrowiae]